MSGWQFMSVAGRDGSQCAPASSEAKRHIWVPGCLSLSLALPFAPHVI